MKLDKRFLITYTDIGSDGNRHACCAWFQSEQDLQNFLINKKKSPTFETDFALEILEHRLIDID